MVHEVGKLMLPKHMVEAATLDMRSLHNSIYFLEERMVTMKYSKSHLLFIAKVPPGRGFVDKAPTEIMLMRFVDIFNLFHLHHLHHTLVRLFSISLAMQILRDGTVGITVVDPYYMRDTHMTNNEEQKIVSDYLKDMMMAN
jgi:hypothetical protein